MENKVPSSVALVLKDNGFKADEITVVCSIHNYGKSRTLVYKRVLIENGFKSER